ncbi:hypothetical protein WJX81_000968 [Elliptochloris bilobata]|uniref:Large ribosomal subunit protein uL30m n=1 Tax=Elliptochloris bilobata TaxID=381761 RepID=A0AAW1SG30_9CHLO
MAEPIRTLFITLKRSFAGTRDTHRRIMESLGLRNRQQTVERANMGSIRGAIDKVKHLLTVETDEQFAARKAAELAAAAPRPPAIGSSGDEKKPITREAEPEEFWQTKAEREGKSAWKDPLAIIGLLAIFFPFVVLGVAIGTGYVDINAGRP